MTKHSVKHSAFSVILYVLILMLVSTGCSAGGSSPPAGRPFDFYIDCTTKEDIEHLQEQPFIDQVFPFTLMIFQRPGYNTAMARQIALLAVPSFEGLEASPYHPGVMKKEDPDIMQDPSRNPILIDDTMAKAEKLSVGDTFYQETRISEEPLSFTVAGIFRHSPLFAQFEAVAVINEQIRHVFSAKVDEMGYTNAYLKAADREALKTYLDTDFIPHLQLKGLSEEEIAAIPDEDLKVFYEDYETHMQRMK